MYPAVICFSLAAKTLAKGSWPKTDKVHDFREKYADTDVFFVDEVSMMDAVLFAGLERMMSEAFNERYPDEHPRAGELSKSP